jgi:peroxiredoxin
VFAVLGVAVVLPGRAVSQLDAMGTLAAALGVGAAGVAVLAALAMLVVGQAIFLVQLFKQHGRLLVRMDELQGGLVPHGALARPEFQPLALGDPAPPFALPTLDGGAESSESLRGAGKPVVLIFAETTCPACAQMLGDAGRWQVEFAGEVTVAVVTSVRDRGMRRAARRHGLSRVLLQSAHETAGAYRIEATPAAVTVDVAGRIASVPALGRDEIAQLIRQTADAEREERRAAEADTLRLIPSAAEQRRTRGSAS